MNNAKDLYLYQRDRAYIPRIAAVHDLCGYGKCSLGVAIPVLSAAGCDVCPVPTSLFSAHTRFPVFHMHDTTDMLAPYLDAWNEEGIELDAIYSGFLGAAEQVGAIKRLYREHPSALRIVDPVMGDAGKQYPTYPDELCAAMGDPVAVRRELAALHKPFWGYAFLLLRVLLVGVFAWALITGFSNPQMIVHRLSPLVNADHYAVSRWIPQSEKTRCGDYTFRLRRAAFARDKETDEACLLLELDTSTLDPFLGAPRLPQESMTIQDSRGQVYPLDFASQRELVFTCRFLFVVHGMEEGADWGVLNLPGPEGTEWMTLRLREGSA